MFLKYSHLFLGTLVSSVCSRTQTPITLHIGDKSSFTHITVLLSLILLKVSKTPSFGAFFGTSYSTTHLCSLINLKGRC